MRQNSFLANADVQSVAMGMGVVVDALQEFNRAEKYAVISAVFNCLYNNKLKEERAVSDVMGVVDNMRDECKRLKIPEFGGAERYIIGEL